MFFKAVMNNGMAKLRKQNKCLYLAFSLKLAHNKSVKEGGDEDEKIY